MSAVEHVVHFTIEGEFLSDHVRDRVKEGAWESALNLLVRDLEGMTHEIAIAILKGEATLTGASGDPEGLGLKRLPADGPLAKAMAESLQFQYGRTFRYREEYWRPYARVTSWGKEDALFALDIAHGREVSRAPIYEKVQERFSASRSAEYGNWRSLFYANDRMNDMLVIFTVSPMRDLFILCEKTKMPPLWFEVPTGDPDVILGKMIKEGLQLEERGECGRSEPESSVRPMGTRKGRGTKKSSKEAEEARREREAARELEDEKAEQQRSERLARIAEQVKAQAETKGGFYRLNLRDSRGKPYAERAMIEVPRNPFLLWALRGFDFESFGKERPEWDVVSPMGLKMAFDDCYHSDWILGAGLSLDEVYERNGETLTSVAMMSATQEQFKLVKEWTAMDFVVLAHPGKPRQFHGTVVVAEPNRPVPPGSIALAEHAGPEYEFAMQTACKEDKYGQPGLIICATGGKLAHLALVGREFKCTVLMVPDAVNKYKGTRAVSVDMDEGKIYHSF